MTDPPPPPSSPPTAPPVAPPPPPSGAPTVSLENVSKWFGDVVAVSDVSFAITSGVTALLGPNGAGKSTILRMLCGLTGPSQGRVLVLGDNPRTERLLTSRIGLVPQQETMFESLNALRFVELSAVLHGLDEPVEAARHSIGVVDLDPDDPRPLGAYSKGMRQRVKLAQAMVHDPAVILLDEPLTGLDPRQRLDMVALFHELGDMGRTVIVSSHVLEEVERFGSNVLVIAQGRLAAQGDFRALRDLMDDRPLRYRLRTDRPRQLAAALLSRQLVSGVRLGEDPDGPLVIVDTDDVVALRGQVAPTALEIEASISELVPLDDDLESVFRYLVDGQ
ncbi:MAG: ABC transporter ATP-binding protein [Actinomycetia bacterium]|nr:ABC transporter ATP-binding protein [Actinomycetes bacterium]